MACSVFTTSTSRTGFRGPDASPDAAIEITANEFEQVAEDDLKREVDERQRRWQSRVHRGRAWFDTELRESHRHLGCQLCAVR